MYVSSLVGCVWIELIKDRKMVVSTDGRQCIFSFVVIVQKGSYPPVFFDIPSA